MTEKQQSIPRYLIVLIVINIVVIVLDLALVAFAVQKIATMKDTVKETIQTELEKRLPDEIQEAAPVDSVMEGEAPESPEAPGNPPGEGLPVPSGEDTSDESSSP